MFFKWKKTFKTNSVPRDKLTYKNIGIDIQLYAVEFQIRNL